MEITNMENVTQEDIRIGAIVCASKLEYNDNIDRWERYAETRLRTEVADIITKHRSEFIEKDDMVERRIDLYVATPDVFWKIVREEATKIATRFR